MGKPGAKGAPGDYGPPGIAVVGALPRAACMAFPPRLTCSIVALQAIPARPGCPGLRESLGHLVRRGPRGFKVRPIK